MGGEDAMCGVDTESSVPFEIDHVVGAARDYAPAAAHFCFRPILLKNSGRENSPWI